MSCYAHEYDFAAKKGSSFDFLTQPARVIVRADGPIGLECLRVDLGAEMHPDGLRPIPVAGSEFLLPCDQIVKAVGQVEAGTCEGSRGWKRGWIYRSG